MQRNYLIYSSSLYFLIYISSSSIQSSSALLFRWIFSHVLHCKHILRTQFLISYAMGYILHPQLVFLSPGILSSTCNETKQYGQWFLQVFAAWEIAFPQLMHVNDSLIFFIKYMWVNYLTQPSPWYGEGLVARPLSYEVERG